MTHDDNVFAALAFRRNVGATQKDIRSYLTFREEPKRTPKDDLKSLKAFEEKGIVAKVADTWFLTPEGYKQAKGSALAAEWQRSDAWIFTSVLYNRELDDCRLHHVIAASDFINHAIPTLAEMHGALNRLVAGRLMKIKKGVTFIPTETALDLLAKAEASCKNQVLEIVNGLRKLLDCPCCGVRLKAVRWRFHLNEARMKQAYDDYGKMIGRKKK